MFTFLFLFFIHRAYQISLCTRESNTGGETLRKTALHSCILKLEILVLECFELLTKILFVCLFLGLNCYQFLAHIFRIVSIFVFFWIANKYYGSFIACFFYRTGNHSLVLPSVKIQTTQSRKQTSYMKNGHQFVTIIKTPIFNTEQNKESFVRLDRELEISFLCLRFQGELIQLDLSGRAVDGS